MHCLQECTAESRINAVSLSQCPFAPGLQKNCRILVAALSGLPERISLFRWLAEMPSGILLEMWLSG
jgi:hypothetical protein